MEEEDLTDQMEQMAEEDSALVVQTTSMLTVTPEHVKEFQKNLTRLKESVLVKNVDYKIIIIQGAQKTIFYRSGWEKIAFFFKISTKIIDKEYREYERQAFKITRHPDTDKVVKKEPLFDNDRKPVLQKHYAYEVIVQASCGKISNDALGACSTDENKTFHHPMHDMYACYSEDTLTLTDYGWKPYWEVNSKYKIATYNPKTELIEFHKPIKRYVYPYNGNMIHFSNQGTVDILITPNHKMWWKPTNTQYGQWKLTPAEELISRKRLTFIGGAVWNTNGTSDIGSKHILPRTDRSKFHKPQQTLKVDTNTWLEFLGYIVSEGSLSNPLSKPPSRPMGYHNVSIYQKKEPHTTIIRECLRKLPFGFTESIVPTDVTKFNIAGGKQLWKHLLRDIGTPADNKHLPHYFRKTSILQAKILFDALMLGDGSIDTRPNRTNMYYSTISKALAYQVQELAMRLGYFAHITYRREDKRLIQGKYKRKPLYRVQMCKRLLKQVDTHRVQKNIETVPYKGKVYCFEVPNHLFVTMRNGIPTIQGNTAHTRAKGRAICAMIGAGLSFEEIADVKQIQAQKQKRTTSQRKTSKIIPSRG